MSIYQGNTKIGGVYAATPKYEVQYYNEQSASAAKTINMPTDLVKGTVVSVLFANGHEGSALTLNGKDVKVNRDGALITIPTHTIDSVVKCIQPYTTLELMYDGTQFIVCGNPLVLSGSSDSASYEVKANGYITQCRKGRYSLNGFDWVFDVQFKTKNYSLPNFMVSVSNVVDTDISKTESRIYMFTVSQVLYVHDILVQGY